MPIIRIVPVCNGKIYVASHSVMDDESSRMDLPMEECVEYVLTQSNKQARKVLDKYREHIHTDASPRFCVKHRSVSSDGNTVYLYVLPLKAEDEISFHGGKFVSEEEFEREAKKYSADLQKESGLLGMAAELWDDFYCTNI